MYIWCDWYAHMNVSYNEFDISKLRFVIHIIVEHERNHV